MRDHPDGVLPINVSRLVRKMVASNIHLAGFGHDHYGSAKCTSGREQAAYAGNIEVRKKPQSRTTGQNGGLSALESCLWRLSWVRFNGYLFVGRIPLRQTDQSLISGPAEMKNVAQVGRSPLSLTLFERVDNLGALSIPLPHPHADEFGFNRYTASDLHSDKRLEGPDRPCASPEDLTQQFFY